MSNGLTFRDTEALVLHVTSGCQSCPLGGPVLGSKSTLEAHIGKEGIVHREECIAQSRAISHGPGVEHFIVVAADTRQLGIGNLIETIGFGEQEISVLSVPCHTRGHVAYLSEGNLFSGDTLFVAGCGRFFEGEASEMDQALNSVFASLPKSTRVFCGHEYTVANLRFAASVEPDNEAVAAKLEWAVAQEEEGVSTVPSTIHEELETNPFMRVRLAEMQTRLGASDAVEAMRILRERKNSFRAS